MKVGELKKIISHWDDCDDVALRVIIDGFQEIIEPDFDIDIPNEETLWLTARIVNANHKFELDDTLGMYDYDEERSDSYE